MENLKKEIDYKITTLRKIKGLKKHNDIWELQTLITTYDLIISMLNTEIDINKRKKITTHLESVEEKFTYFTNLTSSKT